MSLNWDISRIKDFKQVCYDRMTRTEVEALDTTIEALVSESSSPWYTPGESETEKLANCDVVERFSPLTNCFIWATMSVGMGTITKENHGEFWLRLNLLERIRGPFISKKTEEGEGWEPRFITLEEVEAHIGLGTNVSQESWASWTKRQMASWRSDVLRGKKLDAGPWEPPVSQIAKDTGEQISRLQKAIEDASSEGIEELDAEIEVQQEKDLETIYKMEDYVRCIESDWEDIEWKIDDAEQAEVSHG